MWRTYMLAVTTPMVSILPDPLPLVPARIAAVLVRNGSAGYPDVVAWRNERHPVFVELKGPGDTGTSQAKWLSAAIAKGDVTLDDFLLVSWTAKQLVPSVTFVPPAIAFDPLAGEETSTLRRLTILQARMNPDRAMGDELLKQPG